MALAAQLIRKDEHFQEALDENKTIIDQMQRKQDHQEEIIRDLERRREMAKKEI